MLVETDPFSQRFEIAAQHLEILRQRLDLLQDRQGAPQPALEGLTEALLAMRHAYDDLSRQNLACATRCQGLETELAYYRDLFENAPHARLVTDLDGTIQEANTHASILLRASQDALTGSPLTVLLPEQARETLPEHLAQLQAGGSLYGWQVRLQPVSGEAVAVSLDAVPVHGLEHRLVALQWLVRDVSQQVQVEEALRQSEQMLRSFVDQSLDGIALTDEQGQVIEWNPTMEQITGLPAMETIGRPIWDLQLLLDGDVDAAAGYKAQIGDRFRELLRSGQAPWLGQLMERTYVHPDGARRVVQGVVFPFRTRKGFMLGSVSRDVTDLKRAEEALRQSESKHRMLVESLHEGIWFIDEAGDTTFVNPAMARLLGYTVDEMVNVHLRGFVNQVDVEAMDAQLERRRQGISENLDFELRRKDGTQLFVNLNATPIFDASGAYAGALASVRDITQERCANEERQRLLDQLLEDRRRITAISVQEQRQAQELGAILQAIPDAVVVWDTQGTVIRANPAAMALGIGTEKAGMVDVAARLEVRHADGRPIAAEELPVARALRGEVIRNEAEILVSPDDEEHEILVSVAPVSSGDEIIGCVVVSHDITDRRQVEKERERLLSENRSQRVFLERLVEAAPVGIAVLRGPEHRYELVNPYYQRITGVPDMPMVGRTIIEVIPDLVNRRMPQLMDEVYRTGQTVSTKEVKLSFGPGREETYWNTDRVPLHDQEGSVEGILVLAREVTEEVKIRGRIVALSAQAQRQADELAAIFAALVEPVMISDAQNHILKANPAAVEALGVDPANLPEAELARRVSVTTFDGRPIPPDDLVAARALKGERVSDDYQLLVTAGGERAIVASAAPIVSGGQIAGAVLAWHDITELRQAQEALRESEAKYRLLFQNMTEGFALYELLYDAQGQPADWRILEVNNAYSRHTGIPRERIAGRRIGELFPEAIPEYLPRFAQVVATQTPTEFETYAQAIGRHQHVSTFPAGGHRFASTIEDISRRKQSEQDLRRMHAQRALEVQKRSALEERQRLARELHDSVSQTLYGISLGINTARSLFDTDRAKVLEALDYALALTRGGLTEMRALIFELRPESLEMEGLVTALTKQVAALQVRHGIEVELSLCDEPDVPFAVKEAVYRIAQEALHNAVKHAQTDRLDIRLTRESDVLSLEVCDNGRGFDPLAAHPGHLGLRSMRERATKMGGTLEIVSAQDCGTQIRARIPIAALEAAQPG